MSDKLVKYLKELYDSGKNALVYCHCFESKKCTCDGCTCACMYKQRATLLVEYCNIKNNPEYDKSDASTDRTDSIVPNHTADYHNYLFRRTFGFRNNGGVTPKDMFIDCDLEYTYKTAQCTDGNKDVCDLESFNNNQDLFTYNIPDVCYYHTLLSLMDHVKEYIIYIHNEDRLRTSLQKLCIDNVRLIKACLEEIEMTHVGEDKEYKHKKFAEFIEIVNEL